VKKGLIAIQRMMVMNQLWLLAVAAVETSGIRINSKVSAINVANKAIRPLIVKKMSRPTMEVRGLTKSVITVVSGDTGSRIVTRRRQMMQRRITQKTRMSHCELCT